MRTASNYKPFRMLKMHFQMQPIWHTQTLMHNSLAADASDVAVGAVLHQQDTDGNIIHLGFFK